ncbi:MAG: hypothetical protein ACRDIE_03650, partial [Chloroflexota bacterium]
NAAVTRAMQMRSADFRCRLRGVHLDMGYVSDVCVSRHVEECVFLEESRPEVHMRTLPMAKQPFETDVGKPAGDKDAGGPAPEGAGRRTAKG